MAFAYTSEELLGTPFLIRRINITETDTTAEALTHGGPAVVPDIVWPVLTADDPTGTELSITATSTTTVTVDAEADDKTAYVYCLWFGLAAGGIGS